MRRPVKARRSGRGARRSAAGDIGLWRMIDANANRVREGLRVCEDLVRLCLGSEAGFRRVRALRYAVSRQLTALPIAREALLRARDTRQDPGRRSRPSTIRSAPQLLIINLQRAKEGLRVLEDSARVVAPPAVTGFQTLRFRVYDLERDLLLGLAAVRDRRSRRRRRP